MTAVQLQVKRTDRQRLAWSELTRNDIRRVMYGGAKGGGKLMRINEEIPTPEGWVKNKDICVDDYVLGENGLPVLVVGVTEEVEDIAYEFTFSDKTKIIAGQNHLWKTMTAKERRLAERRNDEYRSRRRATRPSRSKNKRPDLAKRNKNRKYAYLPIPKGSIRTTKEIAKSLRYKGIINHSIQQHSPLILPEKTLPIPPYTLGAWLGDGTSASGGITGIDDEIYTHIEADGFIVKHHKIRKSHHILGLIQKLRKCNLEDNKHIPLAYLRSSYNQRLALLQGIMDTDGWCDMDGSCAITLKSKKLFDGVVELLRTFGIIVNVRKVKKTCCNSPTRKQGEYYSAKFVSIVPVFRLNRKLIRQNLTPHARYFKRYIVKARCVGKQKMRCIQIANDDGMYLAGKQFIPTHNSHFLCAWLFTAVWEIMVAAQIKEPPKHPPHVAWMGRKQAVDFTATTLQTWYDVIPEEYYQMKGGTEKDPKHILIADRIAIDYGGLDKQANVNKFNSAEYIILAVDQAEEVSRDDIAVLRGSLRQVLYLPDGTPVVPRNAKGKAIIDPQTKKPYDHWPFKELYTANPRQCWLKEEFITDAEEDASFVPALPTDNPNLPSGYIKTLKQAFGHRPELLKAYLEGDWSAVEGAEQIVKDIWLEEAKQRTCYAPRTKTYIVCDTARFGDDECVILIMENAEIIGKKILGQCRSTDISNRLYTYSQQLGGVPIVVEALGADLGAAVVDELTEMGAEVLSYNPSLASAVKNEQGKPIYYNLRAEAWSEGAKKLSSGMLDEETNTVIECKGMYKELQKELCVPTYKFRAGRILVESKEEIKKPDRLGRSPDHADTYIIGLWAWDKLDYNDEGDGDDPIGYRDNRRRKLRRKSPMVFA